MEAGARIPVFVVTGFLGAGKTSLLNHLLSEGALARTAVIVNEFGEVGLDHLFIGMEGDGVIEMSDGCLCCTIRGELAGTLLGLVGRDIDRPIDRVVIETTGLADPGPVLQAILSDAEVGRHFELSGVITLVDAVNAASTLGEHGEARHQVALADALVVTKADRLSKPVRDEVMDRLAAALRALNPHAPMLARGDEEALKRLFRRRLWVPGRRDVASMADKGHDHHHDHDVNRHGERIAAATIRHDRPMPAPAVEAFLELIASAHGDKVLRIKGLVAVEGQSGPVVIHAVQGNFHEPEPLEAWPDEDHTTRIVVVTRDLDPEFVVRLFAGFANVVRTDTPDRQALLDNPLAIPGMGGPPRRG